MRNKPESKNDVSWVTGIDLCFAYAVSLLTFIFKSVSVSGFNYVPSKPRSDQLLQRYWCSFLCFIDMFLNYIETTEYQYRCINQIDVVNFHRIKWDDVIYNLCCIWEHLYKVFCKISGLLIDHKSHRLLGKSFKIT